MRMNTKGVLQLQLQLQQLPLQIIIKPTEYFTTMQRFCHIQEGNLDGPSGKGVARRPLIYSLQHSMKGKSASNTIAEKSRSSINRLVIAERIA